ncbi:MAG: L,D-transpeptidase [Solirubrobacteraceae bacterium]
MFSADHETSGSALIRYHEKRDHISLLEGIAIRPLQGHHLLPLACAATVLVFAVPAVAAAQPECRTENASRQIVEGPTSRISWRAQLLETAPVYTSASDAGRRSSSSISPSQAAALLVLASQNSHGRCWLKVRLPERPNASAGWINGERVRLETTSWSIVISLAARTLTIEHSGTPARRFRVVTGASPTPTPRGLFSIIGTWRSPPGSFLGSWILGLTAHSDALHHFEGGNGRVGIHGRGGASLRDPLGSADSHGCIRLDNTAIDWIVHTIGGNQLSGISVRVREN